MIGFLVSVLPLAAAHIMWAFPAPRESNSGIKDPYPCGTRGFHVAGAPVTTLSPGRQTLTITETIKHGGAPMRVAISKDNDDGYDEHVLLSHIPHPTNAPATPYTLKITVDIPNIDCVKCSLQVISVMTDKIATDSCCVYPPVAGAAGPTCFSVYHSCANIKINGTGSTLPPSATTLPNVWAQGEAAAWTLSNKELTYNLPHVSFGPQQCVCSGETCANSGPKGPTIDPTAPVTAAPTTITAATSLVDVSAPTSASVGTSAATSGPTGAGSNPTTGPRTSATAATSDNAEPASASALVGACAALVLSASCAATL
jgi:hypothetical protein